MTSRRRARRIASACVLGVVVAAGVTTALLLRDGLAARAAIVDAADEVAVLQTRLAAGDTDGARRAVLSIQADTGRAAGRTDGRLWGAASRLPVVGGTARAAQEVATTLDDLAHDALPPIVEAAGSAGPDLLRPAHGRLDVARLASAGPSMARAHAALEKARRELRAVDAGSVATPLRTPLAGLAGLAEGVDTAAEASGTAARALRLAPSMLGATARVATCSWSRTTPSCGPAAASSGPGPCSRRATGVSRSRGRGTPAP